jgi:putative toxin-antitoxin system antitoxin component (TIGR02293 family)
MSTITGTKGARTKTVAPRPTAFKAQIHHMRGTSDLIDQVIVVVSEEALAYTRRSGLDGFLAQMYSATPMQTLETERKGVSADFLADLAKRMELPYVRLATLLGISKATAARKSAANALIDGTAVVGMVKLLSIAQEIVDDSTSPEAKNFDTVKWLGQWMERPQPALGGRRPSEFLDSPTGVAIVSKVLGAMRSGAYQ